QLPGVARVVRARPQLSRDPLGGMEDQISPDQVVEEFGRRRRATWLAVRPWVATLLLACVAMRFAGDVGPESPWYLWVVDLASFAVLDVSLAQITRQGGRIYRCPACEQVPRSWSVRVGPLSLGARRMVDLAPTTCGNCHARLR